MKLNKNKGILFWITGLSGSGKTTLAKSIHLRIQKIYGPTIMISGDDVRKIFMLKGHKKNDRLRILKSYCRFSKYITDQKINIIFAVVGLFNSVRKWNKKNINNYCEIYVQADIKKIIKFGKKKIYLDKNTKNIVGVEIKPEYPIKPNIKLINNFITSKKKLSQELINKINKEIKLK